MITITRRQARSLRAIFRRSALGIAHRAPVPPIVLAVEGDQLCVRHRYAHLAVEHASSLAWPSSGSVALPLEALAEFEGTDESVVALDPVAPDRTVARWSDRGIPRAREHPVLAAGAIAPFPAPPDSWADLPPGLLDALAEATASSAEDDTRYALSCLALRGGTGSVAATDGRQALIWSGFVFPWEGDVLIPRSPIFACRELLRDQPVRVGRTEAHVVIRVGPWTIWSEVKTGVRFPDVDRILPGPGSVATRLRLDPDDARFLLDALGRLPGADEPNRPATVDLNGRIAVRARASGDGPATELLLSRSSYSGDPVRFQANRDLLARAIRLGCGELEVADADSPLVGRDGDRVFAWQPLSKESALGPDEDAVRIESRPHPITTTDPTVNPTERKTTVSEADNPDGHKAGRHGESDDHASSESPAPTGLAALIGEAEALHEALGAARARSGRLVVALRKQKRREKLMASTLASLRQLRLQDVTE